MIRRLFPLLIAALIATAAPPADAASRGMFSRLKSWFGFGAPAAPRTRQKTPRLKLPEAPTLLEASFSRPSKPATAPGWQAELEAMRLGGRGRVFLRENLLPEIASGKRALLEGTDKSKFVLVEANDNSARIPHLLTIATGSRFQPIHLFDVPVKESATVGGMVRSALGAHRYAKNPQDAWIASISLPGKLTIPILHVHGEPHVHAGFGEGLSTREIADWHAFALKNGYRLAARSTETDYQVFVAEPGKAVDNWQVIVVAKSEKLTPATLTAAEDDLLGRMYLDGANEHLSRLDRSPFGYVEVARDDRQLVVRVVSD